MTDNYSPEFDEELDTMLRDAKFGEPDTNTPDDEIMQVAYRLATTDLSGRSNIKQSLYHKLNQQSKTRGGRNMTATVSLKRVAAVFVVAIMFAIASPTLTSLAQTILAQIGQVTVTNETDNIPSGQTSSVTDLAVTPSPIPVDIRENVQMAPYTNEDGAVATYLSADVAATMLNFDIVREPSVLPEGYDFNGRRAFALPNNTFVDSFWVSDSLGEIALTQTRGQAPIDYRVGSAATSSEISIGDVSATLITNANLNETTGRLFNLLLWNESGYTFVLKSYSASADDLVAIAQSMYE